MAGHRHEVASSDGLGLALLLHSARQTARHERLGYSSWRMASRNRRPRSTSLADSFDTVTDCLAKIAAGRAPTTAAQDPESTKGPERQLRRDDRLTRHVTVRRVGYPASATTKVFNATPASAALAAGMFAPWVSALRTTR